MNNVNIINNVADSNGGGVYSHANSNMSMTNVLISGNSANYGGGLRIINSTTQTSGSLVEIIGESGEIALKISKNSPLAIQNTIKAVNCGIDLKLQEGLDFERSLFSKIFKSSDVKEGLKSFIMKKTPEFIDS